MTNEEIVSGLKKRIIDSNLQLYIKMFNEAKIELKSDKYWIDATNFFKELSDKKKSVFFSIVNQIQIDTLSEVLAFLDGIYWVEGQEEDVKLVCSDNPNEELNGELLDIFHQSVYEENE